MYSPFRKGATAIIVSLMLGAQVATAASAPVTHTSINRIANPVVAKISDTTGKSWAKSRIKLYADTLRQATKLRGNTQDALLYRKEVGASAEKYISDIKSGSYTFAITSDERSSVESTVIGYQRDLIKVAKYYVERAQKNDMRETGDMHLTIRSKGANIDINIEPYRVIQSKDKKNIEVDVRMSARVSGTQVGGEASISVEGNIMIIGRDLYVTLRDYSVQTTIQDKSLDEMRTAMNKIKGKTYHQKLDQEVVTAMQESQGSVEMVQKMFTILETESLLTPVAKQGGGYVLMWRKATVEKLVALDRVPDITDLELKNLLIPIDVRLVGKTITLQGYADNVSLDAVLDRNTDGTPVLTLNGQERGTTDMWKWKISKTPSFWAFAGGSREYTMDAQASKNGATATVKKGAKTVGTARIDATGMSAWTYDMSATWEDIKTNWETGKQESEEIAVRLWGTLRDEFGTFTLTPPSLYEEMSKLTEQFN